MINLEDSLTNILIELIKIESVTGNEKNICNILELTLKKYQGEIIRKNNSFIINFNFEKDANIALIGHIDTVPVRESSICPVIKDKKIWGRGACDMKAGLAVMLKIIYDISIGKIVPKYNLSFVFYENEEGIGSNGINYLLDSKNLNNIDFAFILEPTNGRYSLGCLGAITIEKKVLGISAHSANPRTGKNALDEALEIYQGINLMNSEINHVKNLDGLKYYETINVTSLTTSNAFNVIPPEANLTINYRFSPETTTQEAIDLIYEIVGDDNTKIIDAADACYIGSLGDKFLKDGIEREIMQAWTDIAQLNLAGIPSINYGPGSILYAHKPDEHVGINELEMFYSDLKTHLV